jgi:hypothetical protein
MSWVFKGHKMITLSKMEMNAENILRDQRMDLKFALTTRCRCTPQSPCNGNEVLTTKN